jgi:hypothetical protein
MFTRFQTVIYYIIYLFPLINYINYVIYISSYKSFVQQNSSSNVKFFYKYTCLRVSNSYLLHHFSISISLYKSLSNNKIYKKASLLLLFPLIYVTIIYKTIAIYLRNYYLRNFLFYYLLIYKNYLSTKFFILFFLYPFSNSSPIFTNYLSTKSYIYKIFFNFFILSLTPFLYFNKSLLGSFVGAA